MTTENEVEVSPSGGDVPPLDAETSSQETPRNCDESIPETWDEATTAFQRIRTVLKNSSAPRTAADIAAATATTEPTVRRHVSPLVDAGIVAERTRAGTTTYEWNPV